MSRGPVLAIAVAIAAITASLARAQEGRPAATGFAVPPAGAWLRYHYQAQLIEGGGVYERWADATIARARYEVLEVTPARATIRGTYSWLYRSRDRLERASEDRTVSFSLPERRYTSERTDSSDYDDRDARMLSTWIWIPPSVAVGDTIAILDHDFVVVGTDARIEVAGAPRTAIELGSRYQGRRHDEYGRLATDTSDRYWFDRATGMFLREEVREHAVGVLDGASASFTMTTRIDVIDASYAPSPVPVPPDPPLDSMPFGSAEGDQETPGFERDPGPVPTITAFAVLLAFAWLLSRRRNARLVDRAVIMADGSRVSIESVRDASTLALPVAVSPRYYSFLAHFARIAIASGSPVAIARRTEGAIVGLGIGDRDAGVGTIFAPDLEICEELRKAIGHSAFFSEVRHPAPSSAERAGVSVGPHAYNVYETYDVLEVTERPEDLGFDREAVRRYTPADRDGAVAVLTAAYRVRSDRWLDAAIAAGDLAWVALEGDRVIGFAAASLCGEHAHLHALTVHPDVRGRSLGTGLMRARLRALFDLGAKSIVSECATWNLAAREIAARTGLRKVGEMYVESSDAVREDRKFTRR